MFPKLFTSFFSFLDFGVHPEGPETLSTGCSPPESEVIAEVPLATPTMQAVQDSWMGLLTQRAVGVWVLVLGKFGETFLNTCNNTR